MDPYKLLGLRESATDEDINKAYRKLSKNYHPDRNPSEDAKDMFEKITEAKELLLNKTKRKAYDEGGYESVKEYEDYASHREAMRSRQMLKQCEPVRMKVNLKLSEIYNGSEKLVKVPLTHVDSYGKVRMDIKEIPLKISSNFEFGKTVLIQGAGNTKPDHMDGDIMLDLVKEADPTADDFAIEEYDLVLEVNLTLGQVIGGFTVPIKHPNGKTLVATGGALQQPEQSMVFEGYGLPIAKDDLPPHIRERTKKTHGNMVLKLKFDLGSLKTLTTGEKKTIMAALNAVSATKVPTPTIPDSAVPVTGTMVINRGHQGLPFGIPGLEGLGIPGLNMAGANVRVMNNDGPGECRTQ